MRSLMKGSVGGNSETDHQKKASALPHASSKPHNSTPKIARPLKYKSPLTKPGVLPSAP